MLKVISKKGALTAFYYLMAVDEVTSFEEERFQEIGLGLAGEEFVAIKEEIISECSNQIDSITVEDERYDIIQEGIDTALNDTISDVTEGVVPRLLIWNMLTLAHSDDDYSESENRLIGHVSRILQIEKSVFLEMKQLISTANSVQKEQELLEASERTYSEIRPRVQEIEKRMHIIVEAAKVLIEDDIVLDDPASEEQKEHVLLSAGKRLGDSVISSSKKLGDTVTPVAKDLGGKAVQSAAGIKEGAGMLFSRIKDAAKKK